MVISQFPDLRFIRVIRLARILRSIPSPRYNGIGIMVYDLFKHAASPLFAPIYFMSIASIVCAAVVYYAEKAVSLTCELPDGVFATATSLLLLSYF